ncbi:MAG: PilN domain-containing protein [Burkholderiaceae bacterium]|nr:PilN domain-containing protein [Burkholderiaceae bacterium]MDH3459885.1 PilN domain-containing protein [Burkholderiaceae bacterium]
MILINLLPHREERRKRRKTAFFVGLGLSASAGLAVVGFWYFFVQQLISGQQERNEFLKAEIGKLEVQIKDIASLKSEIEALIARQKAVEDLQTDRNMPVYMLDELVRRTPEGVYFRNVKQDGQILTINGVAQTNERVSELLRNTAYQSEWLTQPELIEIQAGDVQTAREQKKRLFNFSVRVSIKRPQQGAQATDAAASTGKPDAAVTPKKS